MPPVHRRQPDLLQTIMITHPAVEEQSCDIHLLVYKYMLDWRIVHRGGMGLVRPRENGSDCTFVCTDSIVDGTLKEMRACRVDAYTGDEQEQL